MKKTFSLLAGLILSISLFSHPWKPNHYIIIDTDGGIDDMRAITMFLASPDVRVLAITISPGALNVDSAYSKVKSLLFTFHHEGLPVAINRSCRFRSPEFPVAMNTSWGKGYKSGSKVAPVSDELIAEIFSYEKTKISFICLGGMSTAASALKNIPAFRDGVKQIIWSSEGEVKKGDFNYSIDIPASESILKEGIPVKLVSGLAGERFYDDEMLKSVSLLPGVYSAGIARYFSFSKNRDHEYSYAANDEMVPLYLHFPDLFKTGRDSLFTPEAEKIQQFRGGALKILAGETVTRNQVIRIFPENPSFYFKDIEPNVSEIITKHGRDEWVSGVLANELHRHLGTFAIIGVKMGIRAREYFNTGVDEFSAVSFAGSTPPMSCMNDGLQVSTGATPGHGLLTVKNDSPMPVVEFKYMNRRIKLSLKPQITEQITSELKKINFVHGLDSNIYWELVRKNTIKYWLELNRHEIFLIEEIL